MRKEHRPALTENVRAQAAADAQRSGHRVKLIYPKLHGQQFRCRVKEGNKKVFGIDDLLDRPMDVVQKVVEVSGGSDAVDDLRDRPGFGLKAFGTRDITCQADYIIGTCIRVKYFRRRDRDGKTGAVLSQAIGLEALGITALLKEPGKQLLEYFLATGEDTDRFSDQFLTGIACKLKRGRIDPRDPCVRVDDEYRVADRIKNTVAEAQQRRRSAVSHVSISEFWRLKAGGRRVFVMRIYRAERCRRHCDLRLV